MVSLAKNMETTVQNFIANAINKPLWNVRRRVGSMLLFETGEKVDEGLGGFHFWVNCGHWWLQQGEGKDFQDIVHSENSKTNMDERILILNGKKLLNIQLNKENNSIIFDFEEDIFLRIAPYGNDIVRDLLYVFTPTEVLSVSSDGNVQIKPSEEK